ncbi:MAG: hypothetical protein NWE94_05705 [Candidatus Bathyarchaeota archaeon]|nr:hypothetical protein [Candidatus Bathyarchaeota archaeon]
MKILNITAIFLLVCFLMLMANSAFICGQATFQVLSTTLTLYRDGLAHCKQQLTLEPWTAEITLPLLSESPQNLLLLDENNTAVDYNLVASNLTAYVLGARSLLIEYDTMALTTKEAEVWSLITNCSYTLTVNLPLNSTVIYLSGSPLSIETKDNTITMTLSPGIWEISYVLPLLTPDDFPYQKDDSNPPTGFPIVYVAAAAIIASAATITAFLLYRKRKGPSLNKILKNNPQLGKEDQEVIRYIKEKGGKAFEAELREQFPDMPRTSLWRLVRRLERLEIVEVKKVGLENQVELKK